MNAVLPLFFLAVVYSTSANDEKEGVLNYNEFIDKYNSRSDKYGLKSFNPKGSVANDALELERNGIKIDNPQAPLTSVYTFHHDDLNINLPTTIRARIDGAALKSVVKPRDQNAINKAVPNLTTVLKTVKDTFGNAYDVGHIIANQLGGPDVDYNYTPMSGPLNRSAYKKMENDVKNWVTKTSKQGGFVDMLVVIYYDDTIFPKAVGVNRAFYSNDHDLVQSIDDVVYANNFK